MRYGDVAEDCQFFCEINQFNFALYRGVSFKIINNMKKNQLKSVMMVVVSIMTVGFFTMGTANAQFTIGIKAAGNSVNYKQLTDNEFGLEAGIFMRFGTNFFFQPEVNYCFKNSNFSNIANEYSSNVELKQHYIAVPALLGYHFINRENFKFRLRVGPRFDFKISDNMDNSEWETNMVQWGGQVGVGLDFWRFALDFDYCIAADNFRNLTQGTSQTNQLNMFILSLGFKFIK